MSDVELPSLAPIEATLKAVDRALSRLREGTYRSCEHCGAAIDDADLDADPLTTNCHAHLGRA